MTLLRLLEDTRSSLASHGVEDARLEADLLLMKALDVDRPLLYASPDRKTTPKEMETLSRDLARRLAGEPLPYICGHREFYGIDLSVKPGVFIPRPETELLVELALEAAGSLPADRPIRIADACTGSGAIAVALAANLPEAAVYATDISDAALETAGLNLRRHRLEDRVALTRGSLLEPVPGPLDMVVSNPPYVPRADIPGLTMEVRSEPREALDGGEDGLDVVRALIPQAKGKLRRPGSLILEVSPVNAGAALALARAAFPDGDCAIHRDLAGRERALLVTIP